MPPLPLPFFKESVTYSAMLPVFLLAAEHVLKQLPPVHGYRWRIDGYTSDRLFLRLPCDLALTGIPHVDEEFELTCSTGVVSMAIFTRSRATLDLYRQVTLLLDQLLARGDP